jgi:methionine synthase II (cobalamin-independent)
MLEVFFKFPKPDPDESLPNPLNLDFLQRAKSLQEQQGLYEYTSALPDPGAIQTLEKLGHPLVLPPFLKSFWKTYSHGGNFSVLELVRIAGYKILEGVNTSLGDLVVPIKLLEDKIEKRLKVLNDRIISNVTRTLPI